MSRDMERTDEERHGPMEKGLDPTEKASTFWVPFAGWYAWQLKVLRQDHGRCTNYKHTAVPFAEMGSRSKSHSMRSPFDRRWSPFKPGHLWWCKQDHQSSNHQV